MALHFDPNRFSRAFFRVAPDRSSTPTPESPYDFGTAGPNGFWIQRIRSGGTIARYHRPGESANSPWSGYAETMRTGKSRYAAGDLLSVPALRKDGAPISIAFTIVPFHDDHGSMIEIAALMRDVTVRFEEIKSIASPTRGERRCSVGGRAENGNTLARVLRLPWA